MAAAVPTHDELRAEVADILIDSDNAAPSAKQVLKALGQRQASWKVPEDRVAKAVAEYNLSSRRATSTAATAAAGQGGKRKDGVEKKPKAAAAAADSSNAKVQKVPPKRPQRTLSDSEDRQGETVVGDKDRQTPPKTSSFADIDADDIANGPAADDDDDDDTDEEDKPSVGAEVLEVLGDSYSETIDDIDTDDGEEFAAVVARRSKFIAKGGSYSIKKVLAGTARSSSKKSGPSRINRRNIPSKQAANDVEDPVDSQGRRAPPKTPMRTVSIDSTDSQIEDEATRRSRFMVKGASLSIRNLLSGKAKKEKRGSALDRRKLHFKHEADAVHYKDKPHKKPQEMNEARLKAEADAKERAAARKAARSSGPRRPQRNTSFQDDSPPPGKPPANEDDDVEDDEEEIIAEADRRSLLFKGGSHSIRNLFSGKGKKSGGLGRFNRRKMHFKKESEAVHYQEKPHLKPAEINARHQQEAARLRAEASKGQASDAPKLPNRRISAESENGSKLDLGEEESKKAVYAEIDNLHGDTDDDLDADADLIAEADKRSKFFMLGGSHSIQKVVRGEARAKKTPGVNRFDRRKLHNKHEAGAVPGSQGAKHANADPGKGSATVDSSEGSDIDADDDIIAEADRRSKFMKAGSYSIQKVVRGEARVKKEGVTRFDRRKLHFKHESEAIHSHDNEMKSSAPNDHAAKAPKRLPSSGATLEKADDDSEFDEEELAMLAEAEADPRRQKMLKGASHSIRNIFSGAAKKKDKALAAGMERRKSQLKNASMSRGLGEDSEKLKDADDELDKEPDRRSTFSLKGASNSIRNLLSRKPGKKDGKRTIDAEIERLHGDDQDDDKDVDDDLDDLDDEDREILEEANKRSNFMAKGASYSITKVLSGSAKKKKEGITRFDRRKMHFKKESEAVHCHDGDKKHPPAQPRSAPALRKPAASMDNAKMPSRRISDGEGLPESTTDMTESPKKDPKDDVDDNDADDDDADDDVDRRNRFNLTGASHSIKKVLAGKARGGKKESGLSRLDRRRIQLKSQSTPRADMDVPGPTKSPGK